MAAAAAVAAAERGLGARAAAGTRVSPHSHILMY